MPRHPAVKAALAALILAACAGTGMPVSMKETIPRRADRVFLVSALPADNLLERARLLLLEYGLHPAAGDGPRSLQTDAAPVGQSRSPLRVSVAVESSTTGSTLTASGETMIAVGIWSRAANGPDRKAQQGFEEMVMMLGRLPHLSIEYRIAPPDSAGAR